MKIVGLIIRLSIVVITVCYAAFCLFISIFLIPSYGLFSSVNTLLQQFSGMFLLLSSIISLVFSVIFFIKKNNKFILAITLSTIIGYVFYVIVEGFGSEIDGFLLLYLLSILLLYTFKKFADKNRE